MKENLGKNLVSVVLAIAVVVLYALHFVHTGHGRIAYIEGNTLIPKYEG